MKQRSMILAVLLFVMIPGLYTMASGQTTGSIAGAVADQNGAAVPNATVKITGQGGQEFTATTSENGTYNVPAVANGVYTVTVTANGFKTLVAREVKVDVGLPSTVNASLE